MTEDIIMENTLNEETLRGVQLKRQMSIFYSVLSFSAGIPRSNQWIPGRKGVSQNMVV